MMQNRKTALLALLPWALSMQSCSRTKAVQYLSPDILENYSAKMNAIETALDDLAEHSDETIRSQVIEYWRQLNVFAEDCLQPFMRLMSEGSYTLPNKSDPARTYRKMLNIPVPPEVKRVYVKYGLGEHGHQVYLCLFLGVTLYYVKQNTPVGPPFPDTVQKALTSMESLINPQDMTLIAEYLEGLR
ncbi:MAG: hypothetical protein LBG73_03700 [Spirochaetaceae bacterium]|jgi:hypothetical protein|nr:hypothetical protein [Spirochaetaceae bacterium]